MHTEGPAAWGACAQGSCGPCAAWRCRHGGAPSQHASVRRAVGAAAVADAPVALLRLHGWHNDLPAAQQLVPLVWVLRGGVMGNLCACFCCPKWQVAAAQQCLLPVGLLPGGWGEIGHGSYVRFCFSTWLTPAAQQRVPLVWLLPGACNEGGKQPMCALSSFMADGCCPAAFVTCLGAARWMG